MVILNGLKERMNEKRHSIKRKNIIMGAKLDLIKEAELATKEWKQMWLSNNIRKAKAQLFQLS
jgi:ribosome biogenesis GTPase A